MQEGLKDIRSKRNPKARVKVLEGHFATNHSHVNRYLDMSTVKGRHNNARETAHELAEDYRTTRIIDTIICLEGTEVIGAFIAEALAEQSMVSVNSGHNISVITPEYTNQGLMILRDNTQRMVKGMQVLIISGSITTGKSVRRALECVEYYGGTTCAVSGVFSAIDEIDGIKINSIFKPDDIPGYEAYLPVDCPMCKERQKVDAIVNGYGYSEL